MQRHRLQLIQHIDFLVSISKELSVELVLKFLDEFYFQIGLGWPVVRAYRAGLHKISLFELDQTKLPFLRNANWEKELTLIDNKIEEEPLSAVHWQQKASRLQDLGRHKEADQASAKATSNNPTLREERGDLLEQSGKHKEAASAYKKTSKLLEEKDYKVLWKVGIAYAKAGLYEKAVNFYDKVINLKPPYPDIYIVFREYGYILEKMEEHDKSIVAYKKALRCEPKFRTASYELRWLYQKMHTGKSER